VTLAPACTSADAGYAASVRDDGGATYPKIELHVHLEGTVRPDTLLAIARRNGYPLPARTVEELAALYEFRDFAHFIEVWVLTTNALQTAGDFRRVVVDYAREAATHGAVYIEGIFSPAERVRRGVDWHEIYSGYCDGAQEARERFGVEVRLTPDIVRGFSQEEAEETVRHAAAYRERGVVGIGLGGDEATHPPQPYERAFRLARSEGLGAVPHAGETAGPASIRAALDLLGAVRLRHGIRAADDPALLEELAARAIVCDVCPISNVRTRAVASLSDHPLPLLVGAGVPCSISTDDPAMFDTDLERDHAAARSLGLGPRAMYDAGLAGALCDDRTRRRLEQIGASYDWTNPAQATGSPLVSTAMVERTHGTG
jgi:aminodeoxyfutalosine deaminase